MNYTQHQFLKKKYILVAIPKEIPSKGSSYCHAKGAKHLLPKVTLFMMIKDVMVITSLVFLCYLDHKSYIQAAQGFNLNVVNELFKNVGNCLREINVSSFY